MNRYLALLTCTAALCALPSCKKKAVQRQGSASFAAVVQPAIKPTLPPPPPPPRPRQYFKDIGEARNVALAVVWGRQMGEQRMKEMLATTYRAIQFRASDIEAVLRRRIVKDDGTLADLGGTLHTLWKRGLRNNGGSTAGARMGLMREFGAEVGAVMAATDFKEMDTLAERFLREGIPGE